MKTTHQTGSLTWIHITEPTTIDIKDVSEEHGLHLRTAEDLLAGNLTSKVDLFSKYLYLALRFPMIHKDEVTDFEIDCVLTENTLITVSYEEIPAIIDLQRSIEANTVLDKTEVGTHAGYLLYFLLSRLYRNVGESLVISERQIDRLENEIFAGKHRDMVEALSNIMRVLVDVDQYITNHQAILPSLEAAGNELLTEDFRYRLRRISGEHHRVKEKVDQLKLMLTELRHTNDSLLTTRQNEVMKIFTIMAFLTFPLSLLSSIFGMNTETMPIVGHPYDFWIIVGAMFVLMIMAVAYFRWKKWI